MRLPKKVCSLDVETEMDDLDEGLPGMLLFAGAKVYSLRGGKYRPVSYRHFLPEQEKELERFLRGVRGIILGHNILDFDYRRLGLFDPKIWKKTVDTLLFLRGMRDRLHFEGSLSLKKLAEENLGERKLSSRRIPHLWESGRREEALRYNENHCSLAFGLWWRMVRDRSVCVGGTEYPIPSEEAGLLVGRRPMTSPPKPPELKPRVPSLVEMGWHKDEIDECRIMDSRWDDIRCPVCGSNIVKEIEMDPDEITEGQWADWMAKFWAVFICLECGYYWDQEF